MLQRVYDKSRQLEKAGYNDLDYQESAKTFTDSVQKLKQGRRSNQLTRIRMPKTFVQDVINSSSERGLTSMTSEERLSRSKTSEIL